MGIVITARIISRHRLDVTGRIEIEFSIDCRTNNTVASPVESGLPRVTTDVTYDICEPDRHKEARGDTAGPECG